MESTHPFSVSFAPCFQAVLCRSQLFFRMFLDKLFQICADRFIMKQKRRCFSPFLLSPSSRRAWIEIRRWPLPSALMLVALLAEGVDRNLVTKGETTYDMRSPSSRRAWIEIKPTYSLWLRCCVALLAEGVDRNSNLLKSRKARYSSPSSRRAWIEICPLRTGRRRDVRRPPRGGRG